MVDLSLVKSVFLETLLKRHEEKEDYLLEKLRIEVQLLVQVSNVQNLQLIEMYILHVVMYIDW